MDRRHILFYREAQQEVNTPAQARLQDLGAPVRLTKWAPIFIQTKELVKIKSYVCLYI
jgi:hypothetical protein